jgi:ferrous iron transport protein A
LVKTLAELKSEENAIVLKIHGGQGLLNRLGALGIIPGKRIRKVSSASMRGPVTIQVNRTQVALGFGMAGKIIVDVDRGVK